MMQNISEYVIFNCIAALILVFYSLHVLADNGFNIKSRLLLIFSMSLSFLVGSRLLYGLLYFDRVKSDLSILFELRLVNFSLYGGLLLSLLVFVVVVKRQSVSVYKISDAMMPVLGLALMLSKLGCFFNGCCYGVPTDLPWGMIFERADGNAVTKLLGASPLIKLISGVNHVTRHPTQLYESGFALLAGIVAFLILRSQKKSNTRFGNTSNSGFATLVFIWIYTLGRFISYCYREFPQATDLSNFIRGPLIYGTILAVTTVLFLLKRR